MPTPQASPGASLARFGVFELDPAGGELRKSGRRVRLQGQPFQILSLLVERSGQIVTREELRQQLWPADTFVDFDHSLNTAINKIRDALGDSATNPRFLETVARRGYRFLAPVEKAEAAAQPLARNAPASDGPRGIRALHPTLQVPLPHRGLVRSLFALVQLMYLVFYLAALFHLRAVDQIAQNYLPGWIAVALFTAVLVTAGVGIPIRCYLISAAALDYRKLAEKFQRIFLVMLLLDELWAIAPFLLTEKIGFGAAFAAAAALLYVPFAERTLLRLAYPPATSADPPA